MSREPAWSNKPDQPASATPAEAPSIYKISLNFHFFFKNTPFATFLLTYFVIMLESCIKKEK